MKFVEDIRRENLSRLVARQGGLNAFCGVVGKSPAQVSQWLNATTDSKTGKPRNMSASSARFVEEATELSLGWLDSDHEADYARYSDTPATEETHVFIPQLDIAVCAGDGRINDQHVQVSGELAFKRSWLAKRGLSAANLRALTCEGLSMLPYLADGDTMLVDITAIEPKHGDVMVLCEGELTQVKRLVRVVDGWLLTSDNPDKTTYRDRPLETTHKVIGRVVWRAG